MVVDKTKSKEASKVEEEVKPVTDAKKRSPRTATKAEAKQPKTQEKSKESEAQPVEGKQPAGGAAVAQNTLDSDGAQGELTIKRAKNSKNVTVGVCHISATFNNTIVVFTDLKGNVLSWSSAGRCGFKGARKSTAYAGQVVSVEAAKLAMGHGVREISIEVKGPGIGRDAAIRSLQTLGLTVSSIKDVTPIPHNGCRPRKRRYV